MTETAKQAAQTPTEDAFESAWRGYNANGNAGGWERVAFISGFGKGWQAALSSAGVRELREALEETASVLKEAQTLVHHGQFHEWKDFNKCTKAQCLVVKKLLAKVAVLARVKEAKDAR